MSYQPITEFFYNLSRFSIVNVKTKYFVCLFFDRNKIQSVMKNYPCLKTELRFTNCKIIYFKWQLNPYHF